MSYYEKKVSRFGDSAPILFVHGMWSNSQFFDRWMMQCALRGINTFALDLTGHGASGGLPLDALGMYGIASDIALMAHRITEMSGRCPIIIAHSMSALAATVASASCEMKALVMLQSAPPRGVTLPLPVMLSLLKPRYSGRIMRKRPFLLAELEARRFVLNRMGAPERERNFREFQWESGRVALDILTGKIRVDRQTAPVTGTLVVGGTHDRLLPPRIQKAIARKLDAPYLEIPAGHFPMLEANAEEHLNNILGRITF